MFGTFQQSCLRIEVDASAEKLAKSLTQPRELQRWLWFERFAIAEPLTIGMKFTGSIGPIEIQHSVDRIESNRLRFLLSQGIDGFHDWVWGEGWVQSRIEGISLLPLSLGQTATLLSLKQYLKNQE